MPREINLTRTRWAERLNEQWDCICETAVNGFIRLGDDLKMAKARLEHGEWTLLVENDLKFDKRVAQLHMRIATWSKEKRNIVSLLPPDYQTISALTRLNDDTLDRLIENGTINPSLKRNEVNRILRLERVGADENRVLSLQPVASKFRTLVLDPAWEYDWLSLAGRAKPGYAMQTMQDLRQLDVRQWAEDECHLYCWTTNNFMYEACKLVEQWGFQHRVVLTWVKPYFGLGSYFRNSTEHVLFATLGKTTTRQAAASIPTHFEAPRGEHSEKPEEFYEIVRKASYPPYGEGNQREARPDFVNLFEEDLVEAAE